MVNISAPMTKGFTVKYSVKRDSSIHSLPLYYHAVSEFPQDDLQTTFRELHNHSKDRRYPALAQFLEEATLAVREEVQQLPTPLRRPVLPLGPPIGYYETYPDAFNNDNASTALVGLGIGLLATAAVSLASSVADLSIVGAQADMDTIISVLEKDGYTCFTPNVAFTFHSAQTDPVLDEFEALTKSGVVFQNPYLPVIFPLLCKVVFDNRSITANYMRRATRETVNFLAALDVVQKIGIVNHETVWIEIGPHHVSVALVQSTFPSTNIAVPSFRRDYENWATLAQSLASLHLAGVVVDWRCLSIKMMMIMLVADGFLTR
ncbi:hypothetical protein BDV28DRAFT_146333 [Aspergillus coremiiformis]|uniref:Malonyl-CoA:ACP transacylase (MAT) domain-containing protein n=1 Tax=Aspergillus coremiiformis TaxID=138285 RepID=A0A5N6ZEP6_9EURO|nr:hypothetical protein BDV28DRAFT_146333 [Aspergillus coremiiformis]